MDALRASLGGARKPVKEAKPSNVTALKPKAAAPARKAAKRVSAEPEAAQAAPRKRAQK